MFITEVDFDLKDKYTGLILINSMYGRNPADIPVNYVSSFYYWLYFEWKHIKNNVTILLRLTSEGESITLYLDNFY